MTAEKQGISNKFIDFFHSLDKGVGAKVVGEDKTVSGKLNEQAAAVVAKTREVDQSRGVTAKFSEYYSRVFSTGVGQKWVALAAPELTAGSSSSTRLRKSRCSTCTRRPGVLP